MRCYDYTLFKFDLCSSAWDANICSAANFIGAITCCCDSSAASLWNANFRTTSASWSRGILLASSSCFSSLSRVPIADSVWFLRWVPCATTWRFCCIAVQSSLFSLRMSSSFLESIEYCSTDGLVFHFFFANPCLSTSPGTINLLLGWFLGSSGEDNSFATFSRSSFLTGSSFSLFAFSSAGEFLLDLVRPPSRIYKTLRWFELIWTTDTRHPYGINVMPPPAKVPKSPEPKSEN